MKFFHLSDLHIGRQLNGYSLKESQERAFSQIAAYVEAERPDAVLICGDIYDKMVPAAEAYPMFEAFLRMLTEGEAAPAVLVISGNHDSPERLSYAASFLERHNIHIAAGRPSPEGLKKVTLSDAYGPVCFYLFPFIRPGHVRAQFGEGAVTDYESAFRMVLERETPDPAARNVILAHQFFTAAGARPGTCDSETAVLMAGGLDNIDVSALGAFDYAALGHLHGAQRVGEERFRYCGTAYPYSVSEEFHKKSVTVVTLAEKGAPAAIRTLPLVSEPGVRRVRGTLSWVLEAAQENGDDYVSITLTDELEPSRFREQLEERYARILDIRFDNSRTKRRLTEEMEHIEEQSPLEAFCQFYETMRACPMTGRQRDIMQKVIEEAMEGETA